MHDTRVELKDGRVFCGPIWMFRPEEGFMTLILDPSHYDYEIPEKLYFRDMVSAVTKDQRGRHNAPGIGPEDEISRARHQGWDGT
jgi:hypothetical protein